MKQYIDKDALVAEIERLKECNRKICGGNFDFLKKSYPEHYYSTEIYDDILSFLDTLEVKEVDLEKAIDGLTAGWIEGEEYGELQNINTCRCVTLGEVKEAMRCMFELGLKAQKVEE